MPDDSSFPREQISRRWALTAALIGFSIAVGLVVWQGARDVFDALRLGGWALLILVPLHLLPQIPDAGSWRVLIDGPRTFERLYWIAWIRQAVGRLLPVTGIGGDLVGVRLLLQGGVSAAEAVASVVVEGLTTLLGQCVFIVLGVVCALRLARSGALVSGLLAGLLVGIFVLALLVSALRNGRTFGRLHRSALRIMGRVAPLAQTDVSDRIDDRVRTLCRDGRRMTLSTSLQLLGMLTGCLEVWAAFQLLGAPISWPESLLVESLNQTSKHVAFFVPGALGVQEFTFVALAPVIGVTTEVALAVSLAKRAVDVAVGVPALLSWQWTEARRWVVPAARSK